MLLKVAKAAAVLLELRLMPFRLGVVVVTATAGQGAGGAGGLRWPRPPSASAGYGCIRLYWDYIMLKIKRVGRWGQLGCTHTQGDACVSRGGAINPRELRYFPSPLILCTGTTFFAYLLKVFLN